MASTPPRPPPSSPTPREDDAAYLRSLLNKNLRVTTTDNRMFWGSFKCTDSESNMILQHTYEYRHPTPQQISDAAAEAKAEVSAALLATGGGDGKAAKGKAKGKVKLDMTARYLGLVVVPGKYIVRIEAEEFASQARGRINPPPRLARKLLRLDPHNILARDDHQTEIPRRHVQLHLPLGFPLGGFAIPPTGC
ncbi:hypothetical protein C8A05DRAFT_15790 [Staphylotrichum tortipilum]|uniref:Sm domain-containing protein n=1 Tax=Staphylotrichum tortipilum TaxID=2831512 RepID=A0AAN6MKY5_9PEZI|nr:hypothetical protein C8A05DRAFT_15790 [Staphylotrichum longicolle]